jgi:medium-chain acyl-[acyl-carrier-protein] hydrolase
LTFFDDEDSDMPKRAADAWIRQLPDPSGSSGSGSLRLFCFPYAGGGATSYRRWPTALADDAEIFAVQPPGREERLGDPAFTDLPSLLAELLPRLLPYLDVPFAFFGHSMGALICAEAARTLHSEHSCTPSHMFVSGSRAPHLVRHRRTLHLLPDDALIDAIRDLNGTPDELLRHPEMMRLLLPLLRADFSILGKYAYQPGPMLTCPITVLAGDRDPLVDEAGMRGWQDLTVGATDIQIFSGDHFYLRSSQAALLQVISDRLRQHKPSGSGQGFC